MNKLAAVMIIAAIIFCPGAGRAQQPSGRILDEIAAKVNNDIILKSDIEKSEKDLRGSLAEPTRDRPNGLQGAQLEQAFNEQRKHLLRNLIDEALLLQVAKEQSLTAELEVAKAMEQIRLEQKLPTMEALEAAIVAQGNSVEEFKDGIRRKALGDQVIRHEVTSRVQMTNEELRNYYDAHTKDFDRPEGVRLQAISIFTDKRSPEQVAAQQKKMDEALAAIKKGDDFATVASKYSEDDNADNGGEFGFFEKDKLQKELEDLVWKLPKGQTTDVVKVTDGMMVFRVADHHPGGILPFELASREVENILFQQRVPPKIREYLTKLRDQGYVRVSQGYVDTGASPNAEKVKEAKSDTPEKK
jgi:peptidyl-prolyl cis-trans isomerase SurA